VKKLKIAMMVVGLVAMLAAIWVWADDSILPATVSYSSLRDEGNAYISSVSYYRGQMLLLTNCVLYSGTTTNAGVQGLTGVTVKLKWGTSASSSNIAANVQSAAAGTWWARFMVPTNWEAPFLEVSITNAAGEAYTYPWKLVNTKAGL
jgi:hypothetical protein